MIVDDGEDFERGFLEHVFHCFADFGAFYASNHAG